MKKISSAGLAKILSGRIDFVLERYVLTEKELCVKPVYKFIEAEVRDQTIPEFCLIYAEADDKEEIYASVNSDKFDGILRKYKIRSFTFHGGRGAGEPCESFYFGGKSAGISSENCKLLTGADKNIEKSCKEDDYLSVIFHDFIEKKIYRDCGIVAVYDKYNAFAGYLAYYEIAENIRDVSYIYVKENCRGKGYGKALLSFFIDKNIKEKKISYYSRAENEISKNLALSLGFMPCAKRTEESVV